MRGHMSRTTFDPWSHGGLSLFVYRYVNPGTPSVGGSPG